MDHELFLVFLHALENWKPSWGVLPGRCQDLLSILVPENSWFTLFYCTTNITLIVGHDTTTLDLHPKVMLYIVSVVWK